MAELKQQVSVRLNSSDKAYNRKWEDFIKILAGDFVKFTIKLAFLWLIKIKL